MSKPASSPDAVRLFATALLVYAAFWNPWLQTGMSWVFIDMAVTFVDTGGWHLMHPGLYDFAETATIGGTVVSAEPPGIAVVLIPFYAVWRAIVGAIDAPHAFQAFNACLSLTLAPVCSALAAVQVAALAGHYGAGRRGRILIGLLFAFGTQAFFFGTTLFKENVAALGVITAFRLAVEPGSGRRRVVAGIVAGAATWVAYPIALLTVLLLLAVARRDGIRAAAMMAAGAAPFAVALAVYNTRFFGLPWRTGYLFLTDYSVWAHRANAGFVLPKPSLLLGLLIGTGGGLFLYAPFLLLGVVGLVGSRRSGFSSEAIVTAVFLTGFWLAAGAWDSQFTDRAGWAHSLGPRKMFPAVPLLAAFAAPGLERLGRLLLFALSIPAFVSGYLSTQAGFASDDPLPYVIKTCISGTGMGVLFKEAIPAWVGFDTLHTMVSRPDVTARDVMAVLATAQGLLLARNQAVMLLLNLVVLVAIAWLVRKLWREAPSLDVGDGRSRVEVADHRW